MKIAGLQTMTLLDFPEKVACTVFTFGCNLRCPFCHNASLVTGQPFEHMSEEAFFSFLSRRKGILDGVAVTGGEPLLHPQLPAFLKKIRDAGFAVKLDTNGCFPARLEEVLSEGLVDYVAMDIKNAPEKYPETVGIADFDVTPVLKSASLLMEGRFPFEFRTTLVKGLHTPTDMEKIGRWLAGDENFFLQSFSDSGDLLGRVEGALSDEKTASCLEKLKAFVPRALLRGRD